MAVIRPEEAARILRCGSQKPSYIKNRGRSSYSLSTAISMKLILCPVLLQVVGVLVNAEDHGATHTEKWKAFDEASGTFFARILTAAAESVSSRPSNPPAETAGSTISGLSATSPFTGTAGSETPSQTTSDTTNPTTSESTVPITSGTTAPTTSGTTSPTTSVTTSPTTSGTTTPTTSGTTSPTTSVTTSPTTSGITAPTTSGTTAPTTSGTTDPTTSGTTAPTTSGTTAPTTSGTTAPTTSGTTAPTTSGTTSPTTSGTTAPTTSGTTAPTTSGTTNPTTDTPSPTTTTTAGTTTAMCLPSGYRPASDPKCKTFYDCTTGILYTCPAGLVFNPVTGYCDVGDGCPTSTTVPPGSSTTPSCGPSGYGPMPGSDCLFFDCARGVTQKCPPGTRFDAGTGYCEEGTCSPA